MSELRTNRIIPRDGLPSGASAPENSMTLVEVSA